MNEVVNLRAKLLQAIKKTIESNKKFDSFRAIHQAILKRKDLFVGQSTLDQQKISYATKTHHKYLTKYRTTTTFGRYIRRKHYDLARYISDRLLESFTSEVMTKIINLKDIMTILSGHEITKAYYDMVGGHTCMTEHKAKFVRIYAENPEKVQLLVLNNCKARALLWTTDNGVKLIDRIYPNGGQHINLYQKWAKENNAFVREHHSIPNKKEIFFIDNTEKHMITLRSPSHNIYPYMDTFRYAWMDNNLIKLSNVLCEETTTILESVSGIWQDNRPVCSICRIKQYHKQLLRNRHLEQYYCKDCSRICMCCSYPVPKQEIVTKIVQGKEITACKPCFSRQFIKCNDCNELNNINEMFPIKNKGRICKNCVNNYIKCNYCNYYDKKIIKENDKGIKICDSCFNAFYKKCNECGNITLKNNYCKCNLSSNSKAIDKIKNEQYIYNDSSFII